MKELEIWYSNLIVFYNLLVQLKITFQLWRYTDSKERKIHGTNTFIWLFFQQIFERYFIFSRELIKKQEISIKKKEIMIKTKLSSDQSDRLLNLYLAICVW